MKLEEKGVEIGLLQLVDSLLIKVELDILQGDFTMALDWCFEIDKPLWIDVVERTCLQFELHEDRPVVTAEVVVVAIVLCN